MEENQNIETKTGVKSPVFNKKNIIIVGIILIAVVIALVVLFSRSPKSTVKQFVKAYNDGDSKKIISLMDIAGIGAYSTMNTQEENAFSKQYKEIKEEMDKASKEEKEELTKFMESSFESIDDKIKCEIIKVEKDAKNKELTNVECKVTFEEYDMTEDITFVIYQKGLTSYIVYISGIL